ncbi:bifunctional Zinc finger C2H2-type/Dual specificity phosphatase [Babesia duncani]|uniref:protein-tyrosine-phosphatase n=1 Tax=Babesia duncani TaxID=323732 RepID=A0AAD9UP10_9APIC|nr:bifunctional Zinc finger C2H2-type/Dual specificity phosphatase [Babesia duncani]
MTIILPWLNVGGIDLANSIINDYCLNGATEAEESWKNFYKPKGVITVCPYIPKWCKAENRINMKCTDHFPEVLKSDCEWLKHLDYDDDYIELHIDKIYIKNTSSENETGEIENVPYDYIIHAVIRANDDDSEPLFKAFDFTFEFVEYIKAFHDRSVIIHCMAGISRSCTLICAYLMKQTSKDFDSIFNIVKSSHKPASPANGFRRQLKLYSKFDYNIPDIYTFWNKCMNYSNSEDNAMLETKYLYACKACRASLFYELNVIPHCAKGKHTKNKGKENECTSIFIEPMDWMANLELQEGKINCKNINCNSKLGYFSWHGRTCNCGFIQAPAFQVSYS